MKEMLILPLSSDFVSREKTEAPSRALAVDFENHLHAWPVNSTATPEYSDEFVTGGKHAQEAGVP
jgi:hypothetical protein